MKRLLLFVFVVLLPAVFVGICNFEVFPDAALLATLMLIITVGIAGIFTWQSGDATPKIARYCICADFVICIILCINGGCHWLLSREVSAAKQGVVERRAEEDRSDERRARDRAEQVELKKAEAELAAANAALQNAERRRLAQLPVSQRRSAMATAEPVKAKPVAILDSLPSASIVPAGASAAMSSAVTVPRKTPDEVRKSWQWILTALAFAEVLAGVAAGAILGGLWEWDKNKNGIPDHLENQSGKAPRR